MINSKKDKKKRIFIISKEIGIKYFSSIIVAILICTFVLYFILKINFFTPQNKLMVKDGVLDLQDWKGVNSQTIKLDGEWEFYPDVLINPENKTDAINEFDKNINIRKYVKVPSSWESYLNKEGSTEGSGTFRLIIKIPKDGSYGIKTKTIRSACRIYLNKEEVGVTGNPSIYRSEFKPGSKYKVGFANSLNKEIELVIQVSSYEYRSGGILSSIEFGASQSIIRENHRKLVIDALIISVCFVLSLYFFFTYLQRRKEHYIGCFSGTSFFMGLYFSTMNEQHLALVFDYNFMSRTRIQVFSMIMVTVCFLQFTHHFFRQYSNKRIMNKIVGGMLLMLILLINNPEKSLSIPLPITQLILLFGLLVSYIYIFRVLLKAIYYKADSLEYIIVITTSLFCYWFILAAKIFFEINLGYIPVFLIFLMLIGTGLLMGHRLQLDYQEANILSERLITYDKLKDEFLAKTSHELRTPLHVILNLTKLLLEGENGTLSSKQQENLFYVYQEGKRLARLVGDLLDADQIKKGELKLRFRPIDSYSIVEGIIKEMNCLILDNKPVILENQISKNLPALKADPDRFRQIIYNLVHNAIKYTESGKIVISTELHNEKVKFKITDTGIGIEEKHCKEIFNTFYQVYEKGNLQQGLGLGLSIVKDLVEYHGGEIYVESTYKRGSSFIFFLPLYDEEIEVEKEFVWNQDNIFNINDFKEIKQNLKEEKIIDNFKNSILIVDDEYLNQKILADALSQLEFNIFLAENGSQALDILKKNKIDLIILDYSLPDMMGDQICKIIRKDYTMVELPILILTAIGRTADLMNIFEYGANDYQKKPIDVEKLIPRIQSLLLMKKSVEEGLKKEFQYFYSQISPHFLYNTLNTIIGLSYTDNEKTRKALYNLAIYFRGKLDLYRQKSLISLEAELELVAAYLEIEQMRYEEKLVVLYDIDEGVKAMIPPLTIQPLVENSVRHGIENDFGKIKIIVKKGSKGYVNIIIEDNGRGITIEKQEELLNGSSRGIGFMNVIKKLKMLNGASLDLDSSIGQGTKIIITIPEVRYHEGDFSG